LVSLVELFFIKEKTSVALQPLINKEKNKGRVDLIKEKMCLICEISWGRKEVRLVAVVGWAENL